MRRNVLSKPCACIRCGEPMAAGEAFAWAPVYNHPLHFTKRPHVLSDEQVRSAKAGAVGYRPAHTDADCSRATVAAKMLAAFDAATENGVRYAQENGAAPADVEAFRAKRAAQREEEARHYG